MTQTNFIKAQPEFLLRRALHFRDYFIRHRNLYHQMVELNGPIVANAIYSAPSTQAGINPVKRTQRAKTLLFRAHNREVFAEH